MPIMDPDRRRAYHREWVARRRKQWFDEHGPCVKCGSTESLEIDHIDRTTKVDHKVWSWSKARREAELAKCQVLCQQCHIDKTHEERGDRVIVHGTLSRGYHNGCRCDECRRANADYEHERRQRNKIRLAA